MSAASPTGACAWSSTVANRPTSPRDPHLTSRYAVNFVKGLQEGEEDPKHLKIIATCKHYFAYDVDAGDASYGTHKEDTYDRHHFNAVVSKADLADYYLPAWEACATEAKAGSIMCSCENTHRQPQLPSWLPWRPVL